MHQPQQVGQLLEARASCEARAVTADTPLHVAVRASALPVVELLLLRPEAGAWLRAKNQTGQLPADCVEKSKKSASAKVASACHVPWARHHHQCLADGEPGMPHVHRRPRRSQSSFALQSSGASRKKPRRRRRRRPQSRSPRRPPTPSCSARSPPRAHLLSGLPRLGRPGRGMPRRRHRRTATRRRRSWSGCAATAWRAAAPSCCSC